MQIQKNSFCVSLSLYFFLLSLSPSLGFPDKQSLKRKTKLSMEKIGQKNSLNVFSGYESDIHSLWNTLENIENSMK